MKIRRIAIMLDIETGNIINARAPRD